MSFNLKMGSKSNCFYLVFYFIVSNYKRICLQSTPSSASLCEARKLTLYARCYGKYSLAEMVGKNHFWALQKILILGVKQKDEHKSILQLQSVQDHIACPRSFVRRDQDFMWAYSSTSLIFIWLLNFHLLGFCFVFMKTAEGCLSFS